MTAKKSKKKTTQAPRTAPGSAAAAAPASGGKALVYAMLGAAIVAMFISSVSYRISNPSRFVERSAPAQQQQQQAMGQQAPGAGMAEIRGLMQQMRENPNDPQVRLEVAQAFMRTGAFDQALMFLEQARALDPNNPEILYHIGVSHFQLQNYAQAADVFEGVLASRGEDPLVLYNLGIINRYYLDNPELGMEYLERAAAQDVADPRVRELIEKELTAPEEHGS
jgi:cytochrome c-type biogenesis protein CcmH/NrfG